MICDSSRPRAEQQPRGKYRLLQAESLREQNIPATPECEDARKPNRIEPRRVSRKAVQRRWRSHQALVGVEPSPYASRESQVSRRVREWTSPAVMLNPEQTTEHICNPPMHHLIQLPTNYPFCWRFSRTSFTHLPVPYRPVGSFFRVLPLVHATQHSKAELKLSS
jgi:hypothetical protein